MKLHLPKLLRNSVLACIAAVASITTTTVGTATFTGGVVAFALASQQALGANVTYTPSSADPVNWTASAIGDTSYASSDNVTLGALQDGTAQLNVTENAAVAGLTINGTYNINVGNGVTLDLSGISFTNTDGVWSSYINSMTGDGVVKLNPSGEWQFGGMASATFNLRTNFAVDSGLIIISGGIDHTWNIEETGSLTVNGDLNFSRQQRMNIKGGDLAANKILLGHPNSGGYDATMKMFSGSITTGMIYTSGTHSSADIFRMEDGTLTFTQDTESAFKAANRDKLTIELLGGTLKADTSSWKIENVDYTIGNVTVDTGEGKRISLLGAISAAESGMSITLAGSGSLVIDHTLDGTISHAQDSTAVLRVSSLAGFTLVPGDDDATYGDTGASGFLSGYRIAAEGSSITEVYIGDSTQAVAVNNGVVSATGFAVRDNVTYDAATLSSVQQFEVFETGVLTISSNDTAPGTINNAGTVVIQKGDADIADLRSIIDKSAGTYGANKVTNAATGKVILENTGNKTLGGDITISYGGGSVVLRGGTFGTAEHSVTQKITTQNGTSLGFENVQAHIGGGDVQQVDADLVVGAGSVLTMTSNAVLNWGSSKSLTVLTGGEFNVGETCQSLATGYIVQMKGGNVTGSGRENEGYVLGLDFYNGGRINTWENSTIETKIGGHNPGTLQIDVNNGKTLTITGGFGGAGTFNKTASGTLLYKGAAFTQGLTISGGTFDYYVEDERVHTGAISGSGTLKVSGGGTLDLQTATSTVGNLAVNADSGLKVSNGAKVTVSNQAQFGINGSVTVKGAGSELKFGPTNNVDFIPYNGSSLFTIEDGGLMDLGENRITFGKGNKIVLNGGTLAGAGDSGTCAVDCHQDVYITSDGTSEISAVARVKAKFNTQVDSGTLTISGNVKSNGGTNSKIVKSGSGALKITSADANIAGGLHVLGGAVEIAGTAAEDSTVTPSSVTLGGTSILNGSITVSEGGSLTFANGAKVNVTSLAGFDMGDGSYSDGAHGFKSGTVTLISGAFSKGNSFTVQLCGTDLAADKYNLTDSGLTLSIDGTGTYFVNAVEGNSTVDATNTVVNTVGFMNYDVAEGATLTIAAGDDFAADKVASTLASVSGNGTVVLESSAKVGSGALSTFDGAVELKNASTLRFEAYDAHFDVNSIILHEGTTLAIGLAGGSLTSDIVVAGGGIITGNYGGSHARYKGTISGTGVLNVYRDITWGNPWGIDSLISDGEDGTLALKIVGTNIESSISTPEGDRKNDVTLNGANTYTGGTIIEGGATVTAGNTTALGVGNVELTDSTLKLASDLVIDGNFLLKGGSASVNYAADGSGHNLTITGTFTGQKESISFGTAGKSSTITIEGNLETEDLIRIESGANSNHMTVLKLNGDENVMKRLELSGSDYARVILGENTLTTLSGAADALWMNGVNSNTGIILEENATLVNSSQKITFVGRDGGTSLIRKNAANGNTMYELGDSGYTLTDMDVSVDTSAGALTIGNRLTNSSVTNAGSNLLTVNNAANTLSGVHATGGNVAVSGITSIGTVSAALGKQVSIDAGNMTVSALTLNGGSLVSTGALTLNALAVDFTKYDINATHTLVTAGGALNLDAIDLDSYASGIDGFNVLLTKGEDNTLTLAFVADVPATTLLVNSAKTFAAADATGKTTILLAGGTLSMANDAIPNNTITTLEVGELGGTLQGSEAGTVSEVTFQTATVNGELSIADGGTDLTVKLGALTVGEGGSITVAADQTLELTSGTNSGIFTNMMQWASGEGTVKLNGDGGDPNRCRINLAEIEGTRFTIGANYNIIGAGHFAIDGGAKIAEGEQETFVLNKKLTTTGVLRVQRGAIFEVSENGIFEGTIQLGADSATDSAGHANSRGHILVTGGTLKLKGLSRQNGQNGVKDTLTMEDGVLEFTQASNIDSNNIATTINGGTLKADLASWSITGATIGGTTVNEDASLTYGVSIVTADGKSITLNAATLKGTIDNSQGKLVLSGETNIISSGYNVTSTVSDFSSTKVSTNVTTNGFATTDTYYKLTASAEADKLDVSGATFKVGSDDATYVTTGDYTGYVCVNGKSYGTVFYVNSDTVTYTADNKLKDGANEMDVATEGVLTAFSLNGGTLELQKSPTVALSRDKASTIYLNDLTPDDETKVTLTYAQLHGEGIGTAAVTLIGNGVYDLGETNYSKGEGVALSADAWTGTVKVTNANSSGVALDIIGSLNALGNDKSTVAVAGFKGYFKTTDQITNGLETNLEIVKDTEITINNGNGTTQALPERKALISGDVSGEGDIRITLSNFGSSSGTLNYDFAGDVSDWTGSLINTTAKSLTVGLSFTGAATDVGVSIVDNSTQSTTKLTLDADSDMTMNGVVTVDELTVEQNTTFNNSVSATTFTNNAETTLAASHEVEAEDGSKSVVANTFTLGTLTNNSTLVANGALTVTTLNNDGTATVAEGVTLTASTLANSATLNVEGTLADGAAVTNSGTLNLTQAEATFASLAGIDDAVGTISAVDTALTVTGDATSGAITAKSLVLNGASNTATGITADSLTLNGATNSLGELNLGALTLGAGVTSLSATSLTTSGSLEVGKVVENLISITTLESDLTLRISEEVLHAALSSNHTLTLGTVGLNGKVVTLEAVNNDGQYTYILDTTDGVLTLKSELNGLTWAGDTTDTDNKWLSPSNWGDGTGTDVPGVAGTETAVKFLGGGSPVVVIGDNSDVNRTVSVKHITIEIADYVGGGNDVLGDETPTKEGYTFVRADGSDWNILEVTNDLSVLSGALHADVGVNIYSKGRTEVLDGAELHISQQAFVRAMKGIDVSGTVTIDAYDRNTPGVASSRNDGKLYVVKGGSINIIQTQDAGTDTPNVYVGNVKVNGVLGAFSFDDENDLPITDYSYDQLSYDADGSNISNDGILTNEHGSVIAEGNLTNSGTLTQTFKMGGEGTPRTWVYGTLTNTGKGSVTEGDTQRNLGVSIENGEVLVGALDNQGDFTLSGVSNLGVTGFVTLTPNGAATEVEGKETLEDGSEIKKTTTTTNYDVTTQAAQVTNSGNLSITGASTMLVHANQDYTVTHEVVEYEDGRIDITTTRKPLAKPEVHNGKLTNSGTITINSEPWSDSAALEVQGELENAEGGTLALQKGKLLVTSALINEGEVAISGGSAESAYVDNFGELKVSGGSLIVYDLLLSTDKMEVSGGGTMVAADKMINEGGLTIAGGATMYVGNGSAVELPTAEGIIVLDDFLENSGTITIGSVAVADDPDTEEVETAEATTGNLVVMGNLSNTGEDNNIVVNANSSLTVQGNLAANDMSLGFDGKVTVGGTATMENLTIAEGGEFTAENATISDTFTNNGKLTVTTTMVVDGKGDPVLDSAGNYQYTGGKLVIGTLTGGGEVHVKEGGSLSIVDSVEFTGLLDNKGSMEFTATDAVVTLKNAQEAGHTAGDLTAAGIKLTADATGSVVDGKETSYQMGDIRTDELTIADVNASSPRVTMNSLDSKSEGEKIVLSITDIEDKTMTSGSAYLIHLQYDMEGGILDEFNLFNYGYNENGAYDKTLSSLQEDYMQNLLKQGNRVYFSDTNPSATADELKSGTGDVYVYIDKVQDSENVWHVGNAITESGLTVLKDSALLSNDILDNVKKVVVDGEAIVDLTKSGADGKALTSVKLNNLTAAAENSNLLVKGDTAYGDTPDTVTITTAEGGYDKGNLKLQNVKASVSGKVNKLWAYDGTVADLALTDSNVMVFDDPAASADASTTLTGKMTKGTLTLGPDTQMNGSTMELDKTKVVLGMENKVTAEMLEGSLSELEIKDLGDMTGTVSSVEVVEFDKNFNTTIADQYYKYFDMSTAKLKDGSIVADRNTSHYSDNYSSESANGAAGLEIADEILTEYYPQLNRQEQSELANALDAIENAGSSTARDELAASLAGASSAVLGMAVSGDVDRQLRAIRNRTTTMGVDQSVANEDMPYFNAWINAEGSMNELSDNGTEGGYKLNSWGGTVGFDVDICPTFTAGMAFTAMYGDLDVTGADTATGDLDTYYLSAFARYSESAWTHTFVATVGTGDISLKRTVLGSEQKVETDALSFGLMYEVGRVFALDEDGSACLQPVFNVTWKHTTVDGYTEDGSDLALKVDEQTVDTVTFGLGARLQAVVGESMYNRTSIFEARVLAKADVGDRNGSADVGLASLGCTKHEVESAEMGAFGLEAGAGLTIPVGEEGGSIFMDASVELRSDYTDVNGTVGYRINF